MKTHINTTLKTALARCRTSEDAAAVITTEIDRIRCANFRPEEGDGRGRFGTWSDVGSVRISSDEVDFLIPNHHGDGRTKVLLALGGGEPVSALQTDFLPRKFLDRRADKKFGYGGDRFAGIPCVAFRDYLSFEVDNWILSSSFKVRGEARLMNYDCEDEATRTVYVLPRGDYTCFSCSRKVYISRRPDADTPGLVARFEKEMAEMESKIAASLAAETSEADGEDSIAVVKCMDCGNFTAEDDMESDDGGDGERCGECAQAARQRRQDENDNLSGANAHALRVGCDIAEARRVKGTVIVAGSAADCE